MFFRVSFCKFIRIILKFECRNCIYIYVVKNFKLILSLNFFLVEYNLNIFFYYFRLFFEFYFFGFNEIICTVIIFYSYF